LIAVIQLRRADVVVESGNLRVLELIAQEDELRNTYRILIEKSEGVRPLL
jgi:hypothetical protein